MEQKIKEGTLTKRGPKKTGAWTHRYWVLSPSKLAYYASQKAAKPKGIIELDSRTTVGVCEDKQENRGKKNCFYIGHEDPTRRVFYIAAADDPTMRSWIEAIEGVVHGTGDMYAPSERSEDENSDLSFLSKSVDDLADLSLFKSINYQEDWIHDPWINHKAGTKKIMSMMYDNVVLNPFSPDSRRPEEIEVILKSVWKDSNTYEISQSNQLDVRMRAENSDDQSATKVGEEMLNVDQVRIKCDIMSFPPVKGEYGEEVTRKKWMSDKIHRPMRIEEDVVYAGKTKRVTIEVRKFSVKVETIAGDYDCFEEETIDSDGITTTLWGNTSVPGVEVKTITHGFTKSLTSISIPE